MCIQVIPHVSLKKLYIHDAGALRLRDDYKKEHDENLWPGRQRTHMVGLLVFGFSGNYTAHITELDICGESRLRRSHCAHLKFY